MSRCEAATAAVAGLSARSRSLVLGSSALLLLAGLSWYWGGAGEPSEEIVPAQEIPVAQRRVPARRARAETDRGRPVPLYWVADANGYLPPVEDREAYQVQLRQVRLIRSAPADETYNCYGWVFAGGAYWIRDCDVPLILEDNRYREVAAPQPGDLIIYRDDDGNVTHCGIVRAAGPDQPVLIESKWREMGRFIHRPEDCTYARGQYTYYHTDRPGHLLTIRQR
jgi:hypothetical protein